jgi:hypothetical protein
MPPASSVFIVGTILLSQVAPYVAKRTKLNENGEKTAANNPEYLDVHVELLNSKTFQLEGFKMYGKCCCDKELAEGPLSLVHADAARKLLNQMKKARTTARSGKCALVSDKHCGDYKGFNSDLQAHSYHKTDDGICSLPEEAVKSIKADFVEMDKLVFHDLHTAMGWGNGQDFSVAGRCCCDKKRKGSMQSAATSGRCGLFKDINGKGVNMFGRGSCGDADLPDWALQSMHNYEGVEGSKCALTKEQLDLAGHDVSTTDKEKLASYLLEARPKPKNGDLVDLHVELMNSKTFQLDQDLKQFNDLFGRCCCDQQGLKATFAGVQDQLGKLISGAKKEKTLERSGVCDLALVYECGDYTKQVEGKKVSWHEFQGTDEGGKCILDEEQLTRERDHSGIPGGSRGSIRDYYKDQDSLVLKDLHTKIGEHLVDKDWEGDFGRCCCDKPDSHPEDEASWTFKKTMTTTPFTSGRCGLFKGIESCGQVHSHAGGYFLGTTIYQATSSLTLSPSNATRRGLKRKT